MSILKMLEEYDDPRGRVVSFELSADKRTITVEECCDNYFKTHLTTAEFGQMIEELKALYAQMEGAARPEVAAIVQVLPPPAQPPTILTTTAMTEAKAREMLKDEIQPDGGLFSGGHYMAWTPGDDDICLDCRFTADELEAIVFWMRRSPPQGGG